MLHLRYPRYTPEGSRFDFCRVNVQDVVKGIKKFNTRKATQYTDLPVKILKEKSDIFGNHICGFSMIAYQRRILVNFKS